MHWEQALSKVRWCFEVGKNVHQEVVRIAIAGIQIFLGVVVGVTGIFACVLRNDAIVKDYDFINAEDSQGAGNLPC